MEFKKVGKKEKLEFLNNRQWRFVVRNGKKNWQTVLGPLELPWNAVSREFGSSSLDPHEYVRATPSPAAAAGVRGVKGTGNAMK